MGRNNTDYIGRPMEDICILENVGIGIRMDNRPERVTALRSSEEMEFTYEDGMLTVNIPVMKEYEVLVVEFPAS